MTFDVSVAGVLFLSLSVSFSRSPFVMSTWVDSSAAQRWVSEAKCSTTCWHSYEHSSNTGVRLWIRQDARQHDGSERVFLQEHHRSNRIRSLSNWIRRFEFILSLRCSGRTRLAAHFRHKLRRHTECESGQTYRRSCLQHAHRAHVQINQSIWMWVQLTRSGFVSKVNWFLRRLISLQGRKLSSVCTERIGGARKHRKAMPEYMCHWVAIGQRFVHRFWPHNAQTYGHRFRAGSPTAIPSCAIRKLYSTVPGRKVWICKRMVSSSLQCNRLQREATRFAWSGVDV